MSFDITSITCPLCPTSPTTYMTMDELGNHRLAAHERPLPEAESLRRLAAEEGVIGRIRGEPWMPDISHWHAARIAGRNGGPL